MPNRGIGDHRYLCQKKGESMWYLNSKWVFFKLILKYVELQI